MNNRATFAREDRIVDAERAELRAPTATGTLVEIALPRLYLVLSDVARSPDGFEYLAPARTVAFV